jgi:very-short-patch-repair endonuclease
VDELFELAEAQHALLARRQARQPGVERRDVARLVRRDVFEPVTREVLRIRGAPRTPQQDLMCAVLDAGPGGRSARRAAAWLWRMPGYPPGLSDVARARERSSRSSAGRDCWPRLLPERHTTVVDGIPVTTLPRTIFDLAALPSESKRLGRIIDTIHGRSPSILHALHAMLPELAQRGRTGITLMRALLDERPPGTIPRTGLERRFESILRNAGIDVPRLQVDLGGHAWIGRVDYYDDARLVIYEIDSALHHTSLTDRRNDERRDREAKDAGFRAVVRITEEAIWYEPWIVVQQVRDAHRQHPMRRPDRQPVLVPDPGR